MTVIYHPEKDRKIEVKDIKLKVNRAYNKMGTEYDQQYVEFTVIGENREYQDFMLLKEFRRHNPEIPVT